MPKYRSATTTHGRNMAGARALWRATGMTDDDFGKPIIAVVNSFTQFVPGHVHLRDLGKLVAEQIEAAGGVAKEFNTIAVDDGIAMGHGGMLYSLPSRELIADSVEYMVNAHCADAMVCISNCDKITPGMLMASLRLNIPVIFVSGGPMEAGKTKLSDQIIKLDLVDAMIQGANPNVSDADSEQIERSACPTCGSLANGLELPRKKDGEKGPDGRARRFVLPVPLRPPQAANRARSETRTPAPGSECSIDGLHSMIS